MNTPSICGLPEASCVCLEPQGHDGPHVCDCGGSWSLAENGDMIPVTFPGGLGSPVEAVAALLDLYDPFGAWR